MLSGYSYEINLYNMRNPETFDPSAYKWVIEITDSDMSKVYYRSIDSSTNFELQPFA